MNDGHIVVYQINACGANFDINLSLSQGLSVGADGSYQCTSSSSGDCNNWNYLQQN